MEDNDKKKVAKIISDLEEKEKIYNEMSKDTLVNMLVLRDLLDDSFQPDDGRMILWYFVSDWTGAKYLTNEEPRKYFRHGKMLYMTDGEVNIRVPEVMAQVFPKIKYGDGPVKVCINIAF